MNFAKPSLSVFALPLLPLAALAYSLTSSPLASAAPAAPPADTAQTASAQTNPPDVSVVERVDPPVKAAATPLPPKITADTVQKMVSSVLKETSAIRQLPIKYPVKSGVRTRAEVEQMVRKQIKEQLTPTELAANEIVLRQLGMAPANFDLRAAYVKVLGEQVGGYYEPKTKRFYTTDRIKPGELEIVMAHELTHALQDQNFGLGRLENWPKHEADSHLGATALVEGDATFLMVRYLMRKPALAAGMMGMGQDAADFKTMPRFMQESLTFPYVRGMGFVQQLFAKGGWAQVSKAFSALPQSTEQVLHPDKYFAREAPIKVKLRDVTPQLGRGWTLLDHDVNGEIGLSLTLSQFIPDQSAVDKAAVGWGGDRYEVYRGPQNAGLVVQDTTWDSLQDANEWRAAYAQRSLNRFKVKPQQRGQGQVWIAAPYSVWLEQRGRRVVVLEGKAGAFNGATLMTALFKN